jgi:hypothetical protein
MSTVTYWVRVTTASRQGVSLCLPNAQVSLVDDGRIDSEPDQLGAAPQRHGDEAVTDGAGHLGLLLPIVLAEGAAGDREVRARKQTRPHR